LSKNKSNLLYIKISKTVSFRNGFFVSLISRNSKSIIDLSFLISKLTNNINWKSLSPTELVTQILNLMGIKKNPSVILENYSKIFMLLGLTLSLFISYLGLEYKSTENENGLKNSSILSKIEIEETAIPITKPPEITPPSEPQQPQSIMDKMEIVKNEKKIVETLIQSTEVGEKDAVIIKNNRLTTEIIEISEKEEVVEDVAFAIIEEAPIYPGCTGTKEERKVCFSEQVSKHVLKNFNSDLAQELGLTPGKQKIFVIFTVNKFGEITDVMARAPHISLEKEAIRVIEMLPIMIPGKQRNKPVGVKYSLPITFNVE
jgi:protein TonB